MRYRLETIDDQFPPLPGTSAPLSSRPKRSGAERSTPGRTDPDPRRNRLIPYCLSGYSRSMASCPSRYEISPLWPGSAGPPVEMTGRRQPQLGGSLRQTNPISPFLAQKRRSVKKNKPNLSQFHLEMGAEGPQVHGRPRLAVMLSKATHPGWEGEHGSSTHQGQILRSTQDDNVTGPLFWTRPMRQTNPMSRVFGSKTRIDRKNRPNQSQFPSRWRSLD